jgi:hypothetical protein
VLDILIKVILPTVVQVGAMPVVLVWRTGLIGIVSLPISLRWN